MSNPRNPKNLRNGNIITLIKKPEAKDAPTSFSGCPMIFRGLSFPLVYVSVDTMKLGQYDYHTSYDLRLYDVLSVPKNFLNAIGTQKTNHS